MPAHRKPFEKMFAKGLPIGLNAVLVAQADGGGNNALQLGFGDTT